MQNKIKASPDFDNFESTYNVLGLLQGLKACTFQYEHEKDKAFALVNATKRLYGCYQGREMPLETHHEKFQALMDVIEGYGGGIPVHQTLIDEELEYYEDHERKLETCIKQANQTAKERLTAMIFLLSSDRTRYGGLIEGLQNDKLKGFDNYPKTLSETYNLLVNYNGGGRKSGYRGDNGERENVSFVNKGQPFDKSNKECYNYHKLGHFANECPEKKQVAKDGVQAVTFGECQVIDDDDVHIGASFTQIGEMFEISTSKMVEDRQEVKRSDNVQTYDNDGWDGYEFSSSDDSDYEPELNNDPNDHIPPEIMNQLNIPERFRGRRIYTWGPWYIIRRNNGRHVVVGNIERIRNVIEDRQEEISLTQDDGGQTIDKNWIPLDSQSTIDMFSNPNLLRNIRATQFTMRVRGTGGVETTNMIGDLPGYGQVWFKDGGIANILSLSRVQKLYQVTYDSMNGNCFIIHMREKNMHFCQSREGLYYYDTRHEEFSLIHTVAENKKMFTPDRLNKLKKHDECMGW